MGFRIARIPYPAIEDQVSDVIPLLFFDNKYVFLRGQTGGIKLYDRDEWQLSLIGKYRHYDIPAEFQNEIRGKRLDLGLQGKYRFNPELQSNLEFLSDMVNTVQDSWIFFGNLQRYFIASLFVTLCETCDLLASLFLCWSRTIIHRQDHDSRIFTRRWRCE